MPNTRGRKRIWNHSAEWPESPYKVRLLHAGEAFWRGSRLASATRTDDTLLPSADRHNLPGSTAPSGEFGRAGRDRRGYTMSQEQPPALIRYDAMCKAIVECHRVDEVKELRDKARALEVYAQQARNTEAEDKAREIRNRAQRRMGELLRELPRMPREERAERTHAILGRGNNNNHDERRTASVLSGESDSESGCMLHDQTCISEHEGCTSNDGTCIFPYAAALEANGISRQMANRYQKLAAIPEKDFEVAIRNPSKKPTTARLIREAYRGPEVREAES